MSSDNVPVARPLRGEDFPSFQRLFEEIDELHCKALPQYFVSPKTPVRTPEIFARWLADPDVALYGAEWNGLLIGFIYVLFRNINGSPIHVPRRVAIVDVLVVDKRYRSLGAGKVLTYAGETWAKEKGATEMELDVWEFTESAAIYYEKMGYHTIRRRMCQSLS